MSQLHDAWAAKQRARWIQTNPERFLRPDAHRFIRHDAQRFFRPGCVGDFDSEPSEIAREPYGRKADVSPSGESEADGAGQTDFAINRARWHLAALRFELALQRFERWRRKAGFNPDQPRVPAGNPDGGQWARVDGQENRGPPDEPASLASPQRIRLAGPIPTNDPPPEIPKERPSDRQERNAVLNAVVKWLGRYGGTIGRIAGAAYWLYEYDAEIVADLDPPKSLEELQQAVATPKAGYQRHHIVEQTPAEQAGYPRSRIDDPDNLVLIPARKHREITSWFQTNQKELGGMSPRDYLRNKSWDERRRIGLGAMIDHGVLKP
jgi:hypothetical protein